MKQLFLLITILSLLCTTLNCKFCVDGEDEIKVKKIIQLFPLMQSNETIMSNKIVLQDTLITNCETKYAYLSIDYTNATQKTKKLGFENTILKYGLIGAGVIIIVEFVIYSLK